jgi:hypothetical protein
MKSTGDTLGGSNVSGCGDHRRARHLVVVDRQASARVKALVTSTESVSFRASG